MKGRRVFFFKVRFGEGRIGWWVWGERSKFMIIRRCKILGDLRSYFNFCALSFCTFFGFRFGKCFYVNYVS